MITYRYIAVSPSGEKIAGTVEAYDEFEAVAQIKKQNGIVLKVEEVPENESKIATKLNEPLSVSEKALSLIASQFAILLRAGISSARATEIVSEQTTDKYLKRVFGEVKEDVEAGYSLAQSIESRGKKIPVTFVETIRAGEESGTLETSFEKLRAYYEKSYKLHSKVKSAMTYPAFLLILAVIVIAVVVNVTVPVVSEVIYSAGGDLPGPTKILLGMYNFFNKWWPVILALILLCVIGIRVYKNTEKGRMEIANIMLKLPILGNINTMNAAAQFANTMTTLLSSGLQTTRALTATGRVMDNYAAGTAVSQAVAGIEEGKKLGTVLKGNECFPPLLTEMTAVGEESGTLSETLDTIGAYFDSEVEQASNKALGMLEPIITVVLGVVIGFIVIALYMPMFSMYNSM